MMFDVRLTWAFHKTGEFGGFFFGYRFAVRRLPETYIISILALCIAIVLCSPILKMKWRAVVGAPVLLSLLLCIVSFCATLFLPLVL